MKSLHLLLLVSVISFCGSCAAQKTSNGTASAARSPRSLMDLNQGWKFIRQDVAGAEQPSFDDSSWQAQDLPHTWNGLDGEDGSPNIDADYYRGPGWYRRHLSLNGENMAGKSLFLRFDGACSIADVYVNGKPAGNHKGMFAAFCFDVTHLLNTSGDNVIAVRVTNEPNKDIPPLSADFTFFGGLYRSVHLLATDSLAITPLDDASPGVYVKQANVTREQADLEITTKLRNGSAADKSTSVKCSLLDADGNVVRSADENVGVAANSTADSVQHITLARPHLWNGKKDPYQYKLRVVVSDGSTVTDQVEQPVGLRFFKADPDQGFVLNGQSYPLHGVNRHQDRPHKGWAISPADHAEDFNLIMEMGCTGIRLAHYQHAQEFYDLCDKGGLVVWAEACLVNHVTDSLAFDELARQQLRELIKQNYNHPSICFWSLFNELRDNRNVVPGKTGVQHEHQLDLVNSLNDLAHQLDSTRPTVGATNQPRPDYPLNKITDIIAFNRYYGWYVGRAEAWGAELDKTRAALPGRAVGVSEYGAGASIHQHEPNPPKRPATVSPFHPEEWQCVVHEAAYKAMKERPWLWGTFLWNMFDFAADNRHEGEHAGINDKGMVSYDRKVKKDVFYFYKANWTTDPFVYLTERRYTPREVGNAPVKVYSNCDSVELKVNGTSLGAKTNADHVFVWDAVQLNDGANKLEAIGEQNGKQYTDSCAITFDPSYKQQIPATAPSDPLILKD